MYQETLESKKSSTALDLLLVVLLLLIIIFIKQISVWVSALPSPFNAICQLLVFALIIYIVYIVYAKRIRSYRYSILYDQPEEGAVDENDIPLPRYPYETGSVFFERMIGEKGKMNEHVKPDELLSLLKPGEKWASSGDDAPSWLRTTKQSNKKRKTAHQLIYRRKGKIYLIYFHPTDALIGHIEARLNTNQS